MTRIDKDGLQIETVLHDFLVTEALPGTGVSADAFFAGFSAIVHDLAPKNRDLLAKRDALQVKIDAWYRENGAPLRHGGLSGLPARDRLSRSRRSGFSDHDKQCLS